jgi:hypothetical protein
MTKGVAFSLYNRIQICRNMQATSGLSFILHCYLIRKLSIAYEYKL